MRILFIALALLLSNGCKETVNTYNLPYVEDNDTYLYLHNQVDMCNSKQDSMFCKNSPSVGDIQPTLKYAKEIVKELRKNTKYKVSDDWHYTDTVYEYQVRDCEDEAMTMISHMVNDGIDKKYLYLVYQLTSETTAHMFVGIMTDEGLMHMDANTGIAQIEDKINWHMKMTDVGADKWIKGNIDD